MDIVSFYYSGFTRLKLFDKNLLHMIQEYNFSIDYIQFTLKKRQLIIEEDELREKEYQQAVNSLKSKMISVGNFDKINLGINNLIKNNYEGFSVQIKKALETYEECKDYGYEIIMDILEQKYKGFDINYIDHNESVRFSYKLYM